MEARIQQRELTFREALRTLASVQKTNKGAPAYGRFVNRRLGRLLAAGGYVLGASPNQVTVVSALFTFTGIALVALVSPSPAAAIAVALCLVLGYALDAADGQLSRLQQSGSVTGEWLDHTVDAIKIGTLHLAVLISWYRFDNEESWRLLVPIGFQSAATVFFFVTILMDQLRRAHRGTTKMLLAGDGSSSVLYSLAVLPTDYGLLCLVFALLSWHSGFVAVYTALFALTVAFLVLALPKWYRETRSFT